MWELIVAGAGLFLRASHRGLVLVLGPMLLIAGVAALVLWGQNFHRALIWLILPIGAVAMVWTSSAQLLWLRALKGEAGGSWVQVLGGVRGWSVVAAQDGLETLLLMAPAGLIAIESEKWAGAIIAGFVVMLAVAIWVVTRLKLVPPLVAWHGHGWSAWGESWRLTRGKKSWALGGAWIAAMIVCQAPGLIVRLYQQGKQHHLLLDFFLLPGLQMLGGLAASFWPLAIAAIFCQSVLPADSVRKFR